MLVKRNNNLEDFIIVSLFVFRNIVLIIDRIIGKKIVEFIIDGNFNKLFLKRIG